MVKGRVNLKRVTRVGLWTIGIVVVLVVIVATVNLFCNCGQITLWDWLKLLVVPVVIAGGGLWFNYQQKDRELKIAEQQTQAEALQAYLDYMSQILTDKERSLHSSRPGDPLSSIARARTLSVLTRLNDGASKASVLQFLYESGLIMSDEPVLSLAGADLKGAYLVNANLKGAALRRTNLEGANLYRAQLAGADLENANLEAANLMRANMPGTNLAVAWLKGANLVTANLSKPNLGKPTNLANANLEQANLSDASMQAVMLNRAFLEEANLQGAKLDEACLESATLRNAVLKDAKLRDANLERADLREADLTEAKYLTYNQLKQASGNQKTKLPSYITDPVEWRTLTDSPRANYYDQRAFSVLDDYEIWGDTILS